MPRAWHFLADDGTTIAGTKPEPGGVETFDGLPRAGYCGLHGSIRAIDALRLSRGMMVRRVEITGSVSTSFNKLCGEVRRELWRADATATVHEFSCRVAEIENDQDPRSIAAIETKRKWMRGEATDEELDLAREAAGAGKGALACAAACKGLPCVDAWEPYEGMLSEMLEGLEVRS